MQECAREARRAKRVVEVVWNPFIGFNVDERITEASFREIAMKACMYSERKTRAAVGPSLSLYGPSSESVSSLVPFKNRTNEFKVSYS